ncbi:MAG: VOC family protein [Actinomycetota bacterium]|nr:VOC family protein [Actinomycetota bacterium]
MSEVSEYAPGTPSWVDLATSDAEAAETFYTTLFGWTSEDQGEAAGRYRMLRKGGKDVAALYAMGPEQGPPRWNTYVTVDDVDAAVERVEEAGGVVIAPPFDVFESGVQGDPEVAGRMAVVSDPAGAIVALWQSRGHVGARLVNEPGALCWNELITGDRERAAAFYAAVIGWSSRTNPMGPMTYTEFMIGERAIAGMMEMAGVTPRWNVYFAVEDADVTIAEATGLGASILQPAMDFPDVGRFATLADPQGAAFSVVQLAVPGA